MVKGAWVTLATNDSYSLGALVLAHSLKQVGTQQELAILVTPGVTNPMRERLSDVFNIVKEVNVLDSRDKANLRLLQRPELGITFTKLHCWQLTEYEKCVFLDADTLVLQNCDELFEREELSAAPDVGWPDCFNSGVFVYRPSEDTYNSLIQFALDKGSFDGGDQGLLNLYFSDWARKDISKHLPFIYNVCSTAFYSYLPAFKQFGKDVKIIHFIGNAKPWLQYFDTESKKVRPSRDLGHLEPILQQWWNLFCSMIHPNLSPDMSGLAGAFAKLTLGQHRTPEQEALEDSLRRQNWEQGNIDYLGKDSFDNIWSKICETLSKGPQENEEVKGLELPPSQQETSAPTKEDVLSAPQETPLSADPISPLPPVTVSSDNIPTESEASPKREPSPQDKSSSESVPSATPKAEETSQSEIVLAPVQRPASETSSPAKPVEEIPLLGAKTPESVSVSVEQASSGSLPPTKEVSTPDTDPIPTKQTEVSSSPVAELSAPPKEIAEQETSVEKVLPASQSVPSAPQAPPTEQVASAPHKVSAEESVCPLEAAPQVEETPALKVTPSSPASQEIPESPKVAPTKQSSIFDKTSCAFPKAATPSVEIADPPSTQITKATSEPARIPSEKLSSEEIPQTAPVKELISQLEQFPSDRSSPPEEVTVPSDKPSPPKEPKTPSDKASPPKEAMAPSEKPSPPNETKVPLDTASPPKEAKAPSDKPSPPKETKVPSDKPSPPKEAKVLSDKPSPPKEAKVPSDKTSPPKEAKVPSDKISPPKEAPSSPTQTAPSKPEQIPPKEIPQPEEKVTFSPTQIAPLKVAASAPEGPSTTALEQVSIPPSAETTSISTSPFVSSEPPPPITPPPRKSGGNKKQSKPKK